MCWARAQAAGPPDLKCLLRHDLVFRESGPAPSTEDLADNDELLDGCTKGSGEDNSKYG
jgi:hypothetical protein